MEVYRLGFWVLLLLVQLGCLATGNGVRDPKYRIEFHNLDDEAYVPEDPEMEEMVSMTGKNGSKFECFLPKLEGNLKDNGTSNIAPAAEFQDLRKSPEEILQILNGNCFDKFEGWWTYEFCLPPVGRIRQLHFEGSKKIEAQEFVLGIYDAEASALLHESSPVLVQKDPRSQSAAQKYYAQVYTNGTSCDLTNKPRETEVRFVCSEVGQPVISSIKEAPSCKYTLIFETPVLCRHPLFHEERQPWLTIHCNGPPTEAATVDDDGENVENVETGTLVPVLETEIETESETEEAKSIS